MHANSCCWIFAVDPFEADAAVAACLVLAAAAVDWPHSEPVALFLMASMDELVPGWLAVVLVLVPVLVPVLDSDPGLGASSIPSSW